MEVLQQLHATLSSEFDQKFDHAYQQLEGELAQRATKIRELEEKLQSLKNLQQRDARVGSQNTERRERQQLEPNPSTEDVDVFEKKLLTTPGACA
jgi:hypothetical protein